MKKADNVVSSAYRKIAIDIAKNIVEGKYAEGQKLFGRSVLSSHYNVSPETIRKAVYILKDVGVVTTEKGSGIAIVSAKKAKEFMILYDEAQSVADVRQEIVAWAKRQEEETAEIVKKVNYLTEAAGRIKIFNPFSPFQVTITHSSPFVNQTIKEARIWQNTGATVIAIKRGEQMILSPGPYGTLMEDDIIYFVGSEQSCEITQNYL